MRSILCSLLCGFVFCIQTAAQGIQKEIILKGQVACSKCWTEEDRNTTQYGCEDDLKCAIDCHTKGIPTILTVKTDLDTTLYQLEFGKLKKTKKGWLDYTAKQVEVSGIVHEKKGKKYLKVNTLKISSEASTPQQITATNMKGSNAAEITLKDLGGISQNLKSYSGKIVVLNFWATWCVPCKQEMPAFIKLQNTYAAFGVQVIAASADDDTKQNAVVKFVKENGLNFPVWLGSTTREMASFGVGPSLPATIIIDRNGKIAEVFKGVVTEAELDKSITTLLAAPAKESINLKQNNKTKIAAVSNAKNSSVPS